VGNAGDELKRKHLNAKDAKVAKVPGRFTAFAQPLRPSR
jgi:hypothetical protein